MKNTTNTTKKRFFYHYNKPASHAQGRNVITIHWEGACHLVNKIKTIKLDVESHNQKRQPRCIMRGYATQVNFIQKGEELIGIIC